eukprot:7611125-Pyramimonas_sp.AAC.1
MRESLEGQIVSLFPGLLPPETSSQFSQDPAPAQDFLAFYAGIALLRGTSLQCIQEALSWRSGIALSLDICLQFTEE